MTRGPKAFGVCLVVFFWTHIVAGVAAHHFFGYTKAPRPQLADDPGRYTLLLTSLLAGFPVARESLSGG